MACPGVSRGVPGAAAAAAAPTPVHAVPCALLPPVVPLPPQAFPKDRLPWLGVSPNTILTDPGSTASHDLTCFTSPVISFPGIVGIQVPYYPGSCLPGGRLQDVCGLYYTGGMCQGATSEKETLVSSFLSKGGRGVGNLRLLRETTWSALVAAWWKPAGVSVRGAALPSSLKDNVGLQKVDKSP